MDSQCDIWDWVSPIDTNRRDCISQLIKSNLESFAQPSDPTPSSSKRAKSSYRHETLQEARRLRNLRLAGDAETATSLDLDANVRPRGSRGSGPLAGKDKVRMDTQCLAHLHYG